MPIDSVSNAPNDGDAGAGGVGGGDDGVGGVGGGDDGGT